MISSRWLAYAESLIPFTAAAVNERSSSPRAEKSPPLRGGPATAKSSGISAFRASQLAELRPCQIWLASTLGGRA